METGATVIKSICFAVIATVFLLISLSSTAWSLNSIKIRSEDIRPNIYLKVTSNRVVTNKGQTFIPEGISIYGGLEDPNYMANIPNVNAQIEAAAKYWHTNTIRLQVAESNLFSNITPGRNYNVQFLNELKREVNLARQLNQVVVINDQTEFTSNFPSPTAATVKFWQVMSNVYGNDPYIIFDLFNEPRLDGYNSYNHLQTIHPVINLFETRRSHHAHHVHIRLMSKNLIWDTWKYGGKISGVSYVGMQTLVNKIRGWGVNNIIWVESPFWGQKLPPANSYLISGSNIVYSYHHINLNNPTSWQTIGKFAGLHAVVDGEWSQYQSPWAECYSRAPFTTSKYLQYLKSINVGMIAWSLQSGSLIKGNQHIIPSNTNSSIDPKKPVRLRTPSKFWHHYRCNSLFGHGAGQLIKQYFKQNSVKI